MMMRCFMCVCACLVSVCASARTDYGYMISFYAIKPDVDSKLSAHACNAVLGQPLYYNIIDDKPVYFIDDKSVLKMRDYQRLSTTHLNENQTLYSGQSSVELILSEQAVQSNAMMFFVHDRSQRFIRGYMRIPGYCQASLIGVDITSAP